jgi:hypothetical protein
MQTALSGLGTALRAPVLRAAAKHWWLTLPIGLLAWSSWQERKKRGDASVQHLIADLTPAVTLAIGVVTLNLMLEERERVSPATAAKPASSPRPAPTPGAVKDADFTLKPKA